MRSLRLWRRDRHRNRAAKVVVEQVGWYRTARDWLPYPTHADCGKCRQCPHCGRTAVAVRSENWRHDATDDVFGIDVHWCSNNHMWVSDLLV